MQLGAPGKKKWKQAHPPLKKIIAHGYNVFLLKVKISSESIQSDLNILEAFKQTDFEKFQLIKAKNFQPHFAEDGKTNGLIDRIKVLTDESPKAFQNPVFRNLDKKESFETHTNDRDSSLNLDDENIMIADLDSNSVFSTEVNFSVSKPN